MTKPRNPEAYRSLSPDELKHMWQSHEKAEGASPRVIEYDEIIKAKSIDQLFGRDHCLIVFYPNFQSGNAVSGHYITLIKNKGTIFFYDPYGVKPDQQKEFAGRQRKELYDERENTLIRLLLDSGYNVDYNQYPHQSKQRGVATCGRHSLNRCLYWFLNTDQYNQLIKYASKKKRLGNDDYMASEWV